MKNVAVKVVLVSLGLAAGLAVVAWVCFWYYSKGIPKYTDDELWFYGHNE